MSKTDLEIQYEQIQEKIDSLPKGYLSKKKAKRFATPRNPIAAPAK